MPPDADRPVLGGPAAPGPRPGGPTARFPGPPAQRPVRRWPRQPAPKLPPPGRTETLYRSCRRLPSWPRMPKEAVRQHRVTHEGLDDLPGCASLSATNAQPGRPWRGCASNAFFTDGSSTPPVPSTRSAASTQARRPIPLAWSGTGSRSGPPSYHHHQQVTTVDVIDARSPVHRRGGAGAERARPGRSVISAVGVQPQPRVRSGPARLHMQALLFVTSWARQARAGRILCGDLSRLSRPFVPIGFGLQLRPPRGRLPPPRPRPPTAAHARLAEIAQDQDEESSHVPQAAARRAQHKAAPSSRPSPGERWCTRSSSAHRSPGRASTADRRSARLLPAGQGATQARSPAASGDPARPSGGGRLRANVYSASRTPATSWVQAGTEGKVTTISM